MELEMVCNMDSLRGTLDLKLNSLMESKKDYKSLIPRKEPNKLKTTLLMIS
jgi:hypothetical protein